MALLQKLKSILGLGGSDRDPGERREVGVTVEREAGEPTPSGAADEPGTDDAAATEETASDDDATTTTDAAETADEASTETTDEAEPADEAETPEDDLEDIKGVGPAYAQRLRDAGVTSVADLAEADAEELADETDLSPNRIGNWIEQAKVR